MSQVRCDRIVTNIIVTSKHKYWTEMPFALQKYRLLISAQAVGPLPYFDVTMRCGSFCRSHSNTRPAAVSCAWRAE